LLLLLKLYPGGPVAQWLEQSTHNALVLGSSPGRPTNQFINTSGRNRAHPATALKLAFIHRSIWKMTDRVATLSKSGPEVARKNHRLRKYFGIKKMRANH